MRAAITCPDCGGSMEVGFIPDHSHHHTPIPLLWYAGEPEAQTFLGMKTGAIKTKRKEGIKVRAIRCRQCGLLKLYALKTSSDAK